MKYFVARIQFYKSEQKLLSKKESLEYLFNWNEIPGDDILRLIDFLKQNYGIDWVKTAKIEKSDYDKIITVSEGKNALLLKLNDEQTEVNLKIDDGRTDKFIVKTENGKLNIYSPEKPIELIERLLRENPEYKPEKEKRGIGLLFGNFMPDTGKLVAAKVGRSKEGLWEDYDIKAKKFIETPKTKFPSVLILWDSAEQAIIVERRTTIFPDIQSFFNALENHFNSLLRPYEIRVSIIPLTRDIDFWNTIEKYDEIYSVTFDLKMPNFLGITNKSVKEILEHVRQENNGSELSTTISNENGTLKLIRDSWVTPFVNWIKLGGGLWLINCAKKHGVKKKIKSTDNAMEIEAPKKLIGDNVEEAKSTIKSLKKEYEIKDYSNEDVINEEIYNEDANIDMDKR